MGPKIASEAIPKHQIRKFFPGGACPHTPLGSAYTLEYALGLQVSRTNEFFASAGLTDLSTQPSSLSAFMISKTHITAQKLRERQLNAKVCGSESAIFSHSFFFLSSDHNVQQRYLENGSSTHRHFITKLMLITARSFTTIQHLHSYEFMSIKLFSALPSCCLLRRTPFSNVVRIRTRSLVPKPKTTVLGLGARLVYT